MTSMHQSGTPHLETSASPDGKDAPPPPEAIAAKMRSADPNLPGLYRDATFWGMISTQFFGAFNDNLYKQLVLLASLAAIAPGGGQKDDQWLPMLLFSLPFVLGSGFAGFLADRYSKSRIIVFSKLAECGVMALAVLAFLSYAWIGSFGLLFVLFLMGTQSTFFGPSKYGILPDLFRPQDLPRANGAMLTTTFVAIIGGMICAGFLKDQFAQHLWLAAGVCVLIALIGTGSALLIAPTPPSQPNLAFEPGALLVPRSIRRLLWRDRPLLKALLASCMFWFVGALVQPSVNALGKLQFQASETWTSILAGSVAIGIAVGGLLAGRLCHGHVNFRVMRAGSVGLVVCLALLSLPGGNHGQWLGYWGSFCVLLMTGVFAGFFAIPLQVFLQARPPEGQKGQVIATMNFSNWVAILGAAPIYRLFGAVLEEASQPPSTMFALTAACILPVAIFYRPREAPPEPVEA